MITDTMLTAHAQIEHLPLEEQQQRLAVVQEALCWLGTPYMHAARLRGVGVDCGQFLAAVFEDTGVIPHADIDEYPHDWHQHRSEERYLAAVERFAHQVDWAPLPGDILLYRFDKAISHGAIVTAWPQIVHSYIRLGVVLDEGVRNHVLREAQVGVWSMWPTPEVTA